MKQHEEYIISIKQMVEGDYDHYEVLKQITQDKNFGSIFLEMK